MADDRPASSLSAARDDADSSPTATQAPAQVVASCDELKYDIVIPLVYPSQPITIPYSAISDGMTTAQWLALSVTRSIDATFTRPDTSPPLQITQRTDDYVKVTGLGHAGVVYINGETGVTKYYEYGRYNGNYGLVRKVSMPNVQMEDHCNPSSASLNALASALTRTNGGPYGFEGAFIKLPDGAFERMDAFVQQRLREVNARTAPAYDINSNHCFTFAVEVAQAGGASANVSSAEDLEVRLVSRLGTSVDAPEDLAVELPSRQIQVLQRRYTPLSVGASGSVPSSFAPPQRPN